MGSLRGTLNMLSEKDNKRISKFLKERGFASLQDYYRSWWWSQKRAEVSQIRPQKCTVCGTSDALNLHHKSYERLGKENLADLIWLCEPHHMELHYKYSKNLKKSIKNRQSKNVKAGGLYGVTERFVKANTTRKVKKECRAKRNSIRKLKRELQREVWKKPKRLRSEEEKQLHELYYNLKKRIKAS